MILSREEIIRMAREVGEAEGMELVFHPVIERLANAAYAAGTAAERKKYMALLVAVESILELKGKIRMATVFSILEAASALARGNGGEK